MTTATATADYVKHIRGGNTEIVNNPVHAKNADISSSHSATVKFKELVLDGTARLSVDHSATLVIDRLVCETCEIAVSYASTLIIKELECKTLNLDVSYASTLKIEGGEIGTAKGKVRLSSLGVCYAKIGRDEVTAENSSTWRT